MPYDILTIGDVSIDEYIKVDEAEVYCDIDQENCKISFPFAGKISVEQYSTSLAGNSNNVAFGCSKLGMKTAIYCEMGDDTFANQFLEAYKDAEIYAGYCKKNTNLPTNVHQIIVYKGERTIFSYHEQYKYKVLDWGNPEWIYYTSLPKNFEAFQTELVLYLKQNPKIGFAFNPGTYHMRSGVEGIKDILGLTHVLFVNKEEAYDLIGTHALDISKTHELLHKLGPKLTVVTDGKKGSSAFDGKNLIEVEVPKKQMEQEVVDKTGAGDAFASGTLSALHYKKDLKEALMWGTINAGGVVREVGAIEGLKSEKEIKETKFE